MAISTIPTIDRDDGDDVPLWADIPSDLHAPPPELVRPLVRDNDDDINIVTTTSTSNAKKRSNESQNDGTDCRKRDSPPSQARRPRQTAPPPPPLQLPSPLYTGNSNHLFTTGAGSDPPVDLRQSTAFVPAPPALAPALSLAEAAALPGPPSDDEDEEFLNRPLPPVVPNKNAPVLESAPPSAPPAPAPASDLAPGPAPVINWPQVNQLPAPAAASSLFSYSLPASAAPSAPVPFYLAPPPPPPPPSQHPMGRPVSRAEILASKYASILDEGCDPPTAFWNISPFMVWMEDRPYLLSPYWIEMDWEE